MRNKIILVVITALIVLLMVSAAYLYIDSCDLKKRIAEKDKDFNARISQERDIVKKDLQERYRSGMESFENMYKNLKAEKKKVREMEAKIVEDPDKN